MHFSFTRGAPVSLGRLPFAWVLCLLAQLVAGCSDSQSADELPVRTSQGQALAASTCVTLQRGSSLASDAHISSHQPAEASGSQPELYVGQVGRNTRHALLRFDTSSIPPHATVTSASLSLWRQGPAQPASLS